MSEVRTKLMPHLGKRVTFRGVFDRTEVWTSGGNDIRRACIRGLEIENLELCQHVWVLGTFHWEAHLSRLGEQIEFSAVVHEYVDSTTKETNYCLHDPSPVKFLYQPALRVGGLPRPRSSKEVAEDKYAPGNALLACAASRELVDLIQDDQVARLVAGVLDTAVQPPKEIAAGIRTLLQSRVSNH